MMLSMMTKQTHRYRTRQANVEGLTVSARYSSSVHYPMNIHQDFKMNCVGSEETGHELIQFYEHILGHCLPSHV